MKISGVPVAVLGLAIMARCATAESEPGLEVTESEEGFLFREGDADVLFYQRAPKSLDGQYERANYVHPLYDLDGNVLTEDFPADHLHHRGIFWAWHQLWVGDRKIGDPWIASDSIWDVENAEVVDGPSGAKALRVRVLWKSPQWLGDDGMPAPIVEESTVIRVHPANEDARAIDFEVELRAVAADVRLGGSEDVKGYGGFSTRIRLPEDTVFTARDGAVTPERTAIEAGPWMDLSARFGESDAVGGMTILVHPTSAGFPQPWILRQSRSMQNPAWPGREPVSLSPDDPLVLRYRLMLHQGAANHDIIEDWQREYADGSSFAITIPPAEREFDEFYAKHISVDGFPVISSASVNDAALREAAWVIRQMLAQRPDVRDALIESGTRCTIMAVNEMTTAVPEHSDLTPAKYWDRRARGLGATPQRPSVSCGEENVLRYPGDPYDTESILVHEFAHAMHDMGLKRVDDEFDPSLRAIYDEAMAAGLWEGKYAATNHHEYWAEGVQSYFDTNRPPRPRPQPR